MLTNNLKGSGLEDDYNLNNQLDYNNIEDSHITNTANNSNNYGNREEELTKALRVQLDYNADNPIYPEYLKCIERIKELEEIGL